MRYFSSVPILSSGVKRLGFVEFTDSAGRILALSKCDHPNSREKLAALLAQTESYQHSGKLWVGREEDNFGLFTLRKLCTSRPRNR